MGLFNQIGSGDAEAVKFYASNKLPDVRDFKQNWQKNVQYLKLY